MKVLLTIDFYGRQLNIIGRFEPEEARTWDYPGYPAVFTAYSAELKGRNILNHINPNAIEEINDICLEQLTN